LQQAASGRPWHVPLRNRRGEAKDANGTFNCTGRRIRHLRPIQFAT
jgi:hypothetical protein